MMKKWITELVVDTIIATILTLLLYVIGIDHTWDDAAHTFIMSFLVMFALGAFKNMKNKKTEDNS